ncbi:hypothetical protein ACFQZW_11525 [Lutibacter aestuarii]|uniref:Uncharacterized protein n=1 Tax=Lutibacter aestuarii TaxID=861111 RepID=A0ABW2Z928_9FLAO
MKKQALLLMIGLLLFAGCSKESDEQITEVTFSDLIIGKWKLTMALIFFSIINIFASTGSG